jgi:RNA polymerase sigma factor (sigma-70 family)
MFGIKRKQYKLKTDDELVNLYKIEQSSLCIAIIYERYGHLVFGVSLKYLKNQEDAQDLTMKIFEELPDKILKHSIQYFKAWLYMVSKNECFMLLRKKGIETSTEFIEKYEGEITEEDEPMKEIQLQLLEKSIELLKPEQKICITLFYIKELSYQEISDELNIPLMKVKSAIQNGKRNIKIQLEEKDEFKIQK